MWNFLKHIFMWRFPHLHFQSFGAIVIWLNIFVNIARHIFLFLLKGYFLCVKCSLMSYSEQMKWTILPSHLRICHFVVWKFHLRFKKKTVKKYYTKCECKQIKCYARIIISILLTNITNPKNEPCLCSVLFYSYAWFCVCIWAPHSTHWACLLLAMLLLTI